MKETIHGTIIKGLIQELVLINREELRVAYGYLFNIKNNKGLASTRPNNLKE